MPCARLIVLLTLMLIPDRLPAQATGKLEGLVKDPTGSPLPQAQLSIAGTSYSALSDAGGHYFINNVPAGVISIRATLIGYRPVEVRDLRVLAGQTITQDFSLESQPLQIQEITVLAAENPLVPRDEVTSKQRVSGEFARELPQDRLEDLLALQPGVVATDVPASQGGTLRLEGLSIRGGRLDEAAIYVDGIPVSPGYRGYGFGLPGTAISIGTNAIEEGSVTTGSSSAEFGNAQSGVISIATRTGTTRLGGALSYETDEPFGVSQSLGFNRIEGSFGGPLARRLTFFVSGVLEGQKAEGTGLDADRTPVFVLAGVDTTVAVPSDITLDAETTYVDVHRFAVGRGRCDQFSRSVNEGIQSNYGLDCSGIRTPGTASSTYQLQGKLNYTYGSGSRITLGHLSSQTQGRPFDYANLYNPAALFGNRKWNTVTSLTWAQTLSRSSERALTLETSVGYQTDRGIRSPLTAESERASRTPFGGFMLRPLRFRFDFENFPLNEELVDNVRFNRQGSRRTPYDLDNPEQYFLKDQYRNNAYGLTGWSESGGPENDFRLYRESRYLARAILDGQVDRYNRGRVGAEFIRYSIDRYQSDLISLQSIGDVYLEDPVRWNLFVENRMDLGDLVLVGGLRYDSYDSRAERPYQLDTIPGSQTFGQYRFGFDPRYQGEFDGQPLSITRPDRSHGYLSPHLQVSFPVTERTNVRLSYAHQVEMPDFALVLYGLNTAGMGSNLDFGKTIAYEFGIRHAFGDNMVLDLAAYNRNNLSNATLRVLPLFDPVTGAQSGIEPRFTNADFGISRGVDLRLDRRIGAWFNGTFGYSYQSAKGTGSDPFTNQTRGVAGLLATAGGVGPPPQAIIPTNFARPHTLTGAFSITVPDGWRDGTALGAVFEQTGLFATLRYGSGTPYTRCHPNEGNESVISGEFCPQGGTSPNGSRLPAVKQFDLRATKGLDLGRFGITAYLDARNLFNFRNLLQVFAMTGGVVSTGDQAKSWASDSALYAAEAAAAGVRLDDGSMDLRFDGAVASGCAAWLTAGDLPAPPNCVYLIRAEERFGDGDHVFTLAEQRKASDANYAVADGAHSFTGPPRLLRVGLELAF